MKSNEIMEINAKVMIIIEHQLKINEIIENPYKTNTKQMQHQCTINENQ